MRLLRDAALTAVAASAVTGAVSQTPRYPGYSGHYDRTYPFHNAIPPEGGFKTEMATVVGVDAFNDLYADIDFDFRFFPRKVPVWGYVNPFESAVALYGTKVGVGPRIKFGAADDGKANFYLLPSVDFLPTAWKSAEAVKRNDPTYTGGDTLVQDGFLGVTAHGTILTFGDRLSFDLSPSIRRYLESKAVELYCPATAWLEIPVHEKSNYESIHVGISKDFSENTMKDVYLRLNLITKRGEEYSSNFFRGSRGEFEIGLGRRIYTMPGTKNEVGRYSLMLRLNYYVDSDKKSRGPGGEYGTGFAEDYPPSYRPMEEYTAKPMRQPKQRNLFHRKTVESTGGHR